MKIAKLCVIYNRKSTENAYVISILDYEKYKVETKYFEQSYKASKIEE